MFTFDSWNNQKEKRHRMSSQTHTMPLFTKCGQTEFPLYKTLDAQGFIAFIISCRP